MTMLAEVPPPLKRLFERLDFALQPKRQALTLLLSHWANRRGSAIAPRPEDIDFAPIEEQEGPVAFTYRVGDKGRDYSLMSGGKALEPLLGSCEPGSGLMDAPHPRNAVRLRRLFETVRRTGEPVVAEFTLTEHGLDVARVEIVAAPLSDQGSNVDAILGGVAIRPVGESRYLQRLHLEHPHPSRREAFGPVVFALGASRAFGERVGRYLDLPLASLEERDFEDGEHKTRPLVSVRGCDVYVIHSLHGDRMQSPNDKLCRLLFFIGALKDAAAAHVTAVVPYLCYGRKDRQTKARDPVTTRYVAELFEAVGTDRVITMEAHNVAAYQNAFRCDTEHLDANGLFASYFLPKIGGELVAVISPDLGGAKRAEAFRERLEKMLGRPVSKGFIDKHRSMGQVTGEIFAGEVDGRIVIVIDDLISTGTTMARVATACRAHGAKRIYVAATHGLFTGGAEALWREPAIDEVVVTDTIPPMQIDPAIVRNRLVVIDAAEIFAEAIERCHDGGSITELLTIDTAESHRGPH
ncbi:ribose-phosphate diphosphokinase [Microvirga sp. 2TAF3]|uniref:ribose-phosphate diphosphokinase n=1 Tax=Microvirga sp. 2TAF3 TaxID=3233014 RepID=UPI003F9B8A8B